MFEYLPIFQLVAAILGTLAALVTIIRAISSTLNKTPSQQAIQDERRPVSTPPPIPALSTTTTYEPKPKRHVAQSSAGRRISLLRLADLLFIRCGSALFTALLVLLAWLSVASLFGIGIENLSWNGANEPFWSFSSLAALIIGALFGLFRTIRIRTNSYRDLSTLSVVFFAFLAFVVAAPVVAVAVHYVNRYFMLDEQIAISLGVGLFLASLVVAPAWALRASETDSAGFLYTIVLLIVVLVLALVILQARL